MYISGLWLYRLQYKTVGDVCDRAYSTRSHRFDSQLAGITLGGSLNLYWSRVRQTCIADYTTQGLNDLVRFVSNSNGTYLFIYFFYQFKLGLHVKEKDNDK